MNDDNVIEQISFAHTNAESVADFLSQQQMTLIEKYGSIDNVLPLYENLITQIDEQIAVNTTNYDLPIPPETENKGITYSTAQMLENLNYTRIWLRNTIWRELLSQSFRYFPSNL